MVLSIAMYLLQLKVNFKQFSFAQLHSLVLFDTYETPSVASTPKKRGARSDVNEGILRIHLNSTITGTSPLDCLE